ncbi:vegetative cell wall protein gp1-like [Panicum virgatum]|uniref:vegetative cell wall protein gp1-like n=1 Tax=Panicum virgatum TaxID=38727 RepID=UPI0019D5372E|nr:vegetative cell wall protein gp1-like [Panicum virgatum]
MGSLGPPVILKPRGGKRPWRGLGSRPSAERGRGLVRRAGPRRGSGAASHSTTGERRGRFSPPAPAAHPLLRVQRLHLAELRASPPPSPSLCGASPPPWTWPQAPRSPPAAGRGCGRLPARGRGRPTPASPPRAHARARACRGRPPAALAVPALAVDTSPLEAMDARRRPRRRARMRPRSPCPWTPPCSRPWTPDAGLAAARADALAVDALPRRSPCPLSPCPLSRPFFYPPAPPSIRHRHPSGG